MTDERIAELLDWKFLSAVPLSDLFRRIHRIVAEAQAEQSAQMERMRSALTAARDVVADNRRSHYETHRWPDGSMDPADRDALNEYDALLRMIDEAMGGNDASE